MRIAGRAEVAKVTLDGLRRERDTMKLPEGSIQ